MPIQASVDALVQTHAGIIKMTFSFEGEFADVLTMTERLFSTEGVTPFPVTSLDILPPKQPNSAKPTSEQAEGVKSRLIVGMEMEKGTDKNNKVYYQWRPYYKDTTGLKQFSRIFCNSQIADQVRNLVPEQFRPSALNTYTAIPPEYQFKALYTLAKEPNEKGFRPATIHSIEAVAQTQAADNEYPYDDSIPF